ncbi:MAG TPA: hypothetical protein DCP25_07755 [Chloroflexi bacterium]|nr:hypothetical protein [Chloroflexota bacterium]
MDGFDVFVLAAAMMMNILAAAFTLWWWQKRERLSPHPLDGLRGEPVISGEEVKSSRENRRVP